MFGEEYYTASSVTRFGEISPLWRFLKRLRHFSESLFAIWQNFEPPLAKFECYWQICIDANGQILVKNRAIWSHRELVSLKQFSHSLFHVLFIQRKLSVREVYYTASLRSDWFRFNNISL